MMGGWPTAHPPYVGPCIYPAPAQDSPSNQRACAICFLLLLQAECC
jgi:hypothetical protein